MSVQEVLVLNVGFGLIITGVVVGALSLMVAAIISFGAFGRAAKNMSEMHSAPLSFDKGDFDKGFKRHTQAMGGMAAGGLVGVLGTLLGILCLASGLVTVAYTYVTP